MSREGPISQAKSSCSLVRRACSSRSDHVCPASMRCRDRSCGEEGATGCCSCCRTRNGACGEELAELRNDCSGGDAIDAPPNREYDRSAAASSVGRENEPAKPAERNRCDVTSRTVSGETSKATGCIPQSARSTFCHHRKTRCSSKPCRSLDATKLLYDYAPCERNKIARGDSSGDRSREFALTSCCERFIDLDDNEEDVVSGDARGSARIEDWTKLNASRNHRRKIADSSCRCRCEYQYQESTVDSSRSSCNSCHHRHRDHHRDCLHWHCCCQRDDSFANANECETSCGISGGKAQHKSWREQMRGEDGRSYAWHRCSKNYPGIISAAREENELVRDENDVDDEDNDDDDVGEENDNDDDKVDDEEDDGIIVINHKDSMCILAEKYKANRKSRAKRCDKDERDRSRNKSRTTTETRDQLRESPRDESASVKHVCRVAHCEDCDVARACRADRGRRRAPTPESEYDRRAKCPLNGTRCCSSRAPCGRTC